MKKLITASKIWGFPETYDSILVADGKISAVGSHKELRKEGLEFESYLKSIIFPGFCDAHLHLRWLGENLTLCDLRGCTSSTEFASRIESYVKSNPDEEFIFGFGWDDRIFNDHIKPSKRFIDGYSCGKKTILTKIDGHSFLVNSAFLEHADITADTPDPIGGRIEKDHNNELTGMLYDTAYSVYTVPKIPKLHEKKRRQFFNSAQSHLLSLGVTSCRTFGTIEDFVTLANMETQKELQMRICACIPSEALAWAIGLSAKTGTGNSRFWTGQIKIFADGSLGSRTAFVSEPYPDGSFGLEVTHPNDMELMVRECHLANLGVAIHAIGDVAVKNVVNILSRQKYPHDTLEHFQCGKPQIVQTAGKNSLTVVANPVHIPLDIKAIPVEWPKLADFSYPIASLIANGAKVAFGSDAPVASANPLEAIACAVTRTTPTSETILNENEAISFAKAVQIATYDSSLAIGGPKRGKIEIGYEADLAIVSPDISGMETWDAVKSKVVATYVAGERVWPR
jgi:hypothetical protein